MNKIILFLALPFLVLAAGCNKPNGSVMETKSAFINQATMDKVIKQLTDSCGEASKVRIGRGVKQVASLWEKQDGDTQAFSEFCSRNFIADTAKLDVLFNKLQRSFEVLYGNFNKMGMDLRIPVDLSGEELTPIDEMFASFSPSSHVTDDLFANKVAFITMLNFPFFTLTEKSEHGAMEFGYHIARSRGRKKLYAMRPYRWP